LQARTVRLISSGYGYSILRTAESQCFITKCQRASRERSLDPRSAGLGRTHAWPIAPAPTCSQSGFWDRHVYKCPVILCELNQPFTVIVSLTFAAWFIASFSLSHSWSARVVPSPSSTSAPSSDGRASISKRFLNLLALELVLVLVAVCYFSDSFFDTPQFQFQFHSDQIMVSIGVGFETSIAFAAIRP
jgi:hypothetical protein